MFFAIKSLPSLSFLQMVPRQPTDQWDSLRCTAPNVNILLGTVFEISLHIIYFKTTFLLELNSEDSSVKIRKFILVPFLRKVWKREQKPTVADPGFTDGDATSQKHQPII